MGVVPGAQRSGLPQEPFPADNAIDAHGRVDHLEGYPPVPAHLCFERDVHRAKGAGTTDTFDAVPSEHVVGS